jgi:hypothetical protein
MLLTNLLLYYVKKLCVNLNFSGPVVLEKRILKIFSNIHTCKNSFPYCGPTKPPGAMKLTNLLLYYIKKLSCKFELFWPSSS